MRISIIGTGYVGLVTGVCLAYKGHNIICVDKKASIVDKINNSMSPIFEPKLEEMLKQVVSQKRLSACEDTRLAVNQTELTIVAVGTPFKDGAIDLTYIRESAREIGEALAEKDTYHVVCIKSTVVPGTTDTDVKNILEEASGKKVGSFGLAMNPEFLREGCAVDDFMMPDRIVIGAYDDDSYKTVSEVYKDIFQAPIIKTNLRTAEMIKYTTNAFLANLISFSNEISNICESVGGIDVAEVFNGLIEDKRIVVQKDEKRIYPGIAQYLKPGCGFGGSCFPKDVKALVTHAQKNSYQPEILKAVLQINELQPVKLVDKLIKSTGNLVNKKIAVLGVAFKPNTDDIRESPALKVIKCLLENGAIVYACDPEALENAAKELQNDRLFFVREYKDALRDADGAILITAWDEYVSITADEFKNLMGNPVLVDGRRVYDKAEMLRAEIKYAAIGQ